MMHSVPIKENVHILVFQHMYKSFLSQSSTLSSHRTHFTHCFLRKTEGAACAISMFLVKELTAFLKMVATAGVSAVRLCISRLTMPSLRMTNVRKMPPLSSSPSEGWGSLESCDRVGRERERERRRETHAERESFKSHVYMCVLYKK